MNLLGLIGQIFKPAVELVDELHTSDEEKLVHKAAMLDTYSKALEASLNHELEGLKARASIVEAEAKSQHWLTGSRALGDRLQCSLLYHWWLRIRLVYLRFALQRKLGRYSNSD
jgi:hypothetical protein